MAPDSKVFAFAEHHSPTRSKVHIALGPVYTMDHEVGPWKMAFYHGLTSWSNFHGPIP